MQTPAPIPAAQRALILGSTSPYRCALLSRLRLPFDVVAPRVDETPLPDETPSALARRLALLKAHTVAQQFPQALVIGSDQVPELDGVPLEKPGTHERATAQLQAMRGKSMLFHTAVAVVCHATHFQMQDIAIIRVRVRDVSSEEIERYLRAEQPYDCAGSAKSEGLGIALLDAIESDDPTALVGLPLIRTCRMLRAAGLEIV